MSRPEVREERAKEVHQNEIRGRHQLNRVYDVLPLHFPVIDYITDKKYNPCPEFNRGLCQANHPHKDEKDQDGKRLDAICEICRYAASLNNPHPAHECKLSRGLDSVLARRKRKYEEDEIQRERERRERESRRHQMERHPEAGPPVSRNRVEPPRPRTEQNMQRREMPPDMHRTPLYSRDWGQKRPRHW